MMAFYEGGLGYTEARDMPLFELLRLHDACIRIGKERERQANKVRNGQ